MRIASVVARYLLGLIFLVFGLNGFFHFIPMPPPTGVAGQFFGAIFASHYWTVIFGLQVLGGVLLLVNRYVPLALVILGPIIVNILFFHFLMAPAGLPLALLVAILWTVVAFRNKQYLSSIFVPRAA
jgi:putative oxidoreductase